MQAVPVRANSLTEQVSGALQAQIRAGEMAPGDRLPTESQLAESFGVSRTVVREAIARLRSDGLIESRQGAGMFVARSSLGVPFRIGPSGLSSPAAVAEIMELRMGVECEAAALAAERATDAQLQAIQRALDSVREAVERGGDGVDEDLGFHRAIVRATGNSRYIDLGTFLEHYVRDQLLVTRRNTTRAGGVGLIQAEHQKIFDAIARRDPEAARTASREHLRDGIRRIWQPKPVQT